MVSEYRLIKSNYGLKAGAKFIYFACPDLYMRRVRRKINGEWMWGGDIRYKFTPSQMVSRYFEPIKLRSGRNVDQSTKSIKSKKKG